LTGELFSEVKETTPSPFPSLQWGEGGVREE
jgi:hypothetical protein